MPRTYKEIEQDTGIRFGIIESHQFATIQTLNDQGEVAPLGVEQSEKIWQFLKDQHFRCQRQKCGQSPRSIEDGNFELPDGIKQGLVRIMERNRQTLSPRTFRGFFVSWQVSWI